MKIKIYFAAANIVAAAMLFIFVVSGQISNLQLQAATINVRERQLQTLEHNYKIQEENLQLLEETGTAVSRTGEVLTDVLTMLRTQGLTMLEFNASEYAIHYNSIETRASIVSKGSAQDIVAFLYDLSQHDSHIQIWRTQIYEEDAGQQLRLTFSVFEERRH